MVSSVFLSLCKVPIFQPDKHWTFSVIRRQVLDSGIISVVVYRHGLHCQELLLGTTTKKSGWGVSADETSLILLALEESDRCSVGGGGKVASLDGFVCTTALAWSGVFSSE